MASAWCLTLVRSATSAMLPTMAAATQVSVLPRSAHRVAGVAAAIQSTTRPSTANSRASYTAISAESPAIATT